MNCSLVANNLTKQMLRLLIFFSAIAFMTKCQNAAKYKIEKHKFNLIVYFLMGNFHNSHTHSIHICFGCVCVDCKEKVFPYIHFDKREKKIQSILLIGMQMA